LSRALQGRAWGGRGSGKSHFFGEMLVEECLAEKGTLAVCLREVQKTLRDSSKRLIESKIQDRSASVPSSRSGTRRSKRPAMA
jgi:phage terminase large subunit